MPTLTSLMAPISLGDAEVRNRIVMSAHGTRLAADGLADPGADGLLRGAAPAAVSA